MGRFRDGAAIKKVAIDGARHPIADLASRGAFRATPALGGDVWARPG
jgi:hypothetical protein